MRCSNYIWVIDNFIAYKDASYIRGFTVGIVLLVLFVSAYIKEQIIVVVYVGKKK